ncbi:glycoside hydrolase family 35 protein [Sphaerobolus stellatus SS14]|nr:glycoside hydrolase family 35 protein [Sphaerobolus stellatus SS14]
MKYILYSKMRHFKFLLALASLATSVVALDGYTVPLGSPGFQHGNSSMAVQFDSRSWFVDGKRIFLWSGEFHPWRLPVPQLWSDILQKMKAAGFNGVSIYIHWGLVEGKPGTLDWNYFRSLETFYETAKRVGLYVVARPGPYINAETTGGGLPGWLTNVEATARTNQTGFVNAWQNYVKELSQITAKYQYPDGPVIGVQSENEFYVSQAMNPTATEAMVLLEGALRKHITKIPLTCNDVYPSGDFASGAGEVDIYGFDSYPGGFDCSQPSVLPELANYYVSAHNSVSPWVGMYIPEFQGGALDGWQGVGYDNCEALLGPEFSNVFYKNNVASGAFAQSFYMLYGGTNWGNIAYPGVYTSYDYGAAIRESRVLAPKYNELKLQGLFYQASPSLPSTKIVTSGAGSPFTSNPGVFVTQLGSGDTATNYYIVRQISNNFTTPISFSLQVNTSTGSLTVPQFGGQITLQGRESKTLVTDYPFGKSVVKYSTAEVLTQTTIDGVDYIVLYSLAGQSIEAQIQSSVVKTVSVTGSNAIKARIQGQSVIVSGSPSGVSAVKFGSTVVIVADKAAAGTFWQPRLSASYDVSPDTPSVLVIGPYLVRNATISGSSLLLTGDIQKVTDLTIIAPSAVKSISWNGKQVTSGKASSGVGLAARLNDIPKLPALPSLKSLVWKSADSLPEIAPSFDDSKWVVANKTSTSRPLQPFAGKVVLYADEYGFHQGSFVFRGYFIGSAKKLDLSVQGGSGFGFSAFLNGKFLGSGQGLSGADTINATFALNATTGQNVLVVVSDSNGLNEDWNSNDDFKSPRGIRGYALDGGQKDFDVWRLTGNLGGEDFPDKVRGPYNEGGFFAERSGATLPGFDDSHWVSSTPFQGISHPGVQVYRTSFTLNIPSDLDVPLALQFTPSPSSNYRAVIYVNGWQFGRFASSLGPQKTFPIPEGIINHRGSNELAVILWALDPSGGKITDLELTTLAVFASGKEVVTPVESPTFKELRG